MSGGAAVAHPLTVRPAVPADCGPIARLHAQCFPRGWDEASFARFLADPACVALMAGAAGDPAGFILARSAADEAEIIALAVAPHARRAGVATLLVAALTDDLRARDARSLFLDVEEENHAAISLYRRAGFRDAGRRPGYYAPHDGRGGRDALVLRLDLG